MRASILRVKENIVATDYAHNFPGTVPIQWLFKQKEKDLEGEDADIEGITNYRAKS